MVCNVISFNQPFIYQLHTQPPEEWDGGVGFVSKEMIQTHCPAPASDIQVYSITTMVSNNTNALDLFSKPCLNDFFLSEVCSLVFL